MLSHLHISNFTLVENLEIEFNRGLTALTGETGAGKSIMLDALALTLGAKADADKVRAGKNKSEVCAEFDLTHIPSAKNWLEDQDLNTEDECILRRVVTKDGRSRSYINGKSVTLAQIRNIGQILVDIHGQHEHQHLLKTTHHSQILDEFAGCQSTTKLVREKYFKWKSLNDKLAIAKTQNNDNDARFQLLSYQVNELDLLDIQEGELAQLEQEYFALSNTEQSLSKVRQALTILSNEENGVSELMRSTLNQLNDLPGKTDLLENAESLLQAALINIDESQSDLDRYLDNAENDPEQLAKLEKRLNQIYEVAAKHKIKPSELTELHTTLASELSGLLPNDQLIDNLETELNAAQIEYQNAADELSDKRQEAAKTLIESVNQKLSKLAMSHARFDVDLSSKPNNPAVMGNEFVEFLISTQPNQEAKPLYKIASGGELSRISLAIQVVIGETSTIPTLIFDEVDVGIGGTTGDVVGKMLRELGELGQVFCVTHLAQVASKSHHHLRVEKRLNDQGAESELTALSREDRIREIARMMGGEVDSKHSLAHAKQMLKAA